MTSEAAAALWAAFCQATGTDSPYSAWGFGSDADPELRTRLGKLVLEGPKRATTSRVADYTDEPMPAPGEYSVILAGDGEPICIIRTTRVDVQTFDLVDEEFAWTEGEGDRSLRYWRDAHVSYFDQVGTPVDGTTPMVLERFEVVWPSPPA